MTIKVNFHDANGINKTLTLKYTQGKEKAVVVNRPEKGVWLELVDDQTNTAPQRIFTKRVGDDLFIHIDDKTDTPPELIIVDYYEDEEVAPILGKDVDQVYHAYVSEVGRADLAIAELSPDTLAGQILAKEAFIFTPAFPAWWLIGGALGGVGLVGLALGGGSGGSGGASNGNNGNNNNGNTPVKPNPVVFDPKKPLDGSVSFDLNGVDKAEISYIPTGATQPKTVVISKGQDGKYVSNDPNVIVDPTTGKVTIPEDKVADNTPVTVVVTKDGLASDPATTEAGQDALEFTKETDAEKGDGSIKFDLNGADGAKVTYTPTDSDKPVTAEITKDADGKYVSNDPNVNVDPNTGIVTIPEDNVKDNSPVDVVIINDGQESDPQKTIAGEDQVEGTIDSIKDTDQHTPPKVTAITDKSNPADDNPETFVVEGKTRPNSEVVIKDKEGNIVGQGKADENGNYKINVSESDKHDIVSGEDLTVITKADGYNPSEEKANIDPNAPINHVGDKVGPQNPPVISTDPTTGDNMVEFPKDGDTEQLNVDMTPKGEDPITVEVSKDKDGNITVEVKDQDGNVIGGKDQLPEGVEVDNNGNVIIKDGALETGTEIEATGEDKAGNESDKAVAEVTEPANPSSSTPAAPTLTAKEDGSVTAELPSEAVVGDKAVIEFKKEGTNEPIKVNLVKTENGWEVASTEPAGSDNLVSIDGNTVTIPEASVADGSIVTAYSQGKDDTPDQKSATSQAKVLPDNVTTLEDDIKITSYNDSNPAKNDITKVLVEGQTEPNAKVQIKDGDVVVAEGVADASGKFRIEFAEPTNSDFQPKDKLTVIATAPNKLPSEQKEGEIPEIAQDSTGFVGDRVAPETPRLVVGKDGSNEVTITPKDPKPGDVITIAVKDNEGNDVELTVTVGEDGTLTPSPDNADKPALTVNPDGTITLDRTQIKDNTPISVTAKDLAGNTSDPAVKNTGFDNVTTDPTIDSIVSKDTSPKADGNPEEFTISGKAPAGSKVTAKDSQGNVIGSTIANEDGTYTITGAYENPNNDIKTGDNITVVAQEIDAQGNPTAAESRPVQKDVSAPEEFSDVIPTQKPEILEPENNGDIPVKLPEDAVKGDQVTIKVGNDDNGDGTLTDDEVDGTVIVEKQEDGTWKPVDGDTTLVKDPIEGNIAIIPDEKAPNGSVIEVESKDQAGNTSSTEKPIDKLEQTATPVIESIQAKDSSNPADGNPEYVVITGTAEPSAVVTVKDPEGNIIGTGIADENGHFEITATELKDADLLVGDKLSVTAQHPAKTESEPATTLKSGEELAVPALQPKTDFDDNVPPSPAEIGKADENGDIPVTLPEDAVKGDQAEITVTQPDGTPSSVIVEKQEDGTWKPVDGDTTLVKDPIEGNVATIPADKAPAGTEIDVVVKDVAGNESKPAEATVGEENTDEPTETTDTPKVSDIKAIDTSNPADNNPEKVEVSGTTTEPNTTVYVKDKDGNIIGQGVSSSTPDENGEYPFTVSGIELSGKDVLTGDDLFVTAEKEGKKESQPATETTNGDAVKVPEVAEGKEGHTNDRTPPTAPDVVQEGNDIIVKLPEDAQPGDKVVISKTTDTNGDGKVDEQDTPSTTTVVKGEDGKWTVDGQDGLGISDKINNDEGTVTVPADNGDIVDAKTVDIAGNESTTDQETVTTPPEQTPTPKDIEITAVDKSNPADTIAEEIIVKGKVDDVPEGTEVRVEDDKGNVIGLGKTDAEGNFEIVVPNDPANPLKEGDKLNVIAEDKAGGKTPSDAGTGLNSANTDVPAIDPTAEGHPNDPTGPSAPQLSKVPGTGAVMVTFPTDANPGDKVEVSYTKEGEKDPTTVIFTKQPDGTWTSSNEDELPSVKDNLSNPQVIIPENSIQDGSDVNAKSIDALIPGEEKAATPVTAGDDAKTATPTFEIVSVDTAAQADGEVDQIKVTGKAEPGSLVVVYDKNGQEIGRVQLDEGETTFNIEIGETAGALTKDDEISVVAKAKDKEVSDPATNNIPEVTEFNDKKAPNAPTVAENTEKGKGDVTITLPAEDPQDPFVKGDELVVTYTDDKGEEKTATLTHDGKGNWNSDDANVPSITAGNNSTTIPEDKVQDKSEVSATLKDVAGNESPATDTSKATAGFDEVSRKPTAEITNAVDTNNDGNPDSVTLAGELKDENGAPLANALITVMGKDAQGEDIVLGTATTNAEGKYEITLETSDTVPASAIEAADTLKVTAIEQTDNAPSRDESAAESVTVPAVTKLAENPTIVGISTDEKSDRTPELFKISGTSEEGATVTAYAKLANGDLVEIGSVKVTNGDAFTLTTKPLAEIDGLDSYSLGDAATEIVLKATKEGQQDSATRDLKAVEVPRGTDENRAEIHPNDKAEIPATEAATVKALPKGFGGANITLPSTEGESLLEVIVTYPQKDNPTATDTVTLTWNGTEWSSNKEDVIAVPPVTKDGKSIVHLPADKVAAKNGEQANKVSVVTKDYAGNSSPAAEETLNEPAGDTTPDRTDVPTIKSGSENNLGDVVAKPGADNDQMEVKYVDNKGVEQTVTVRKNAIEGKWEPVLADGQTLPEGITVSNDGTVTVAANLVKDGSLAEAIGYKDTVPSNKPYNGSDGSQTVDRAVTPVNPDDASVNAAERPTVTPLTEALAGAATVKPGDDNVRVEIEAKGYADPRSGIITEANGKEADIVLVAVKNVETGKWTLMGASKAEYDADKTSLSPVASEIATIDDNGLVTLKAKALQNNTLVKATGYDAKDNHNEHSDTVTAEPNKDIDADEPTATQLRDGSVEVTPGADNKLMKVTYIKPDGSEGTIVVEKGKDSSKPDEWSVKEPADIGSIKVDPTTGKVTFPADTVKRDNTPFKAVGTNADNYDSDLIDGANSIILKEDMTPYADPPTAEVIGNKVVVKPGADSKAVEIQGTTIEPAPVIEKQPDGTWAWKGTPPEGLELQPDGTVTIPADKIKPAPDGIVAVATDPNGATAPSNGGDPVKPAITDTTSTSTEAPTLEAISTGAEQGSMKVTPRDDHMEVTVNYTKEDDTNGSITAIRNPETGKWTLPNVPVSVATIDENGVITINKDELSDGQPVTATGKDVYGNKATSNEVPAPTDPEVINENTQPSIDETEKEQIENNNKPEVGAVVNFRNIELGKAGITVNDKVETLTFYTVMQLKDSAEFSFYKFEYSKERGTMIATPVQGFMLNPNNPDATPSDVVNKPTFTVPRASNGEFILGPHQFNNKELILNTVTGTYNPTYRPADYVDYLTHITVNGQDFTRDGVIDKNDRFALSTRNNHNTNSETYDSQEPLPPVGKPVAMADPDNQGGVKVGKNQDTNDATNKLKVEYIDEKNVAQTLYFKKGTNGWAAFETVLPEGVSIDSATGMVTIAPDSVKDGSNVVVTAFDAKDRARNYSDVKATDDPVPTVYAKADEIGGAEVGLVDGSPTKKFQVTFTDEPNNHNLKVPKTHKLVYEKVGNEWKLVEGTIPNYLTNMISLDKNSGKVNFTGDALLDKSTISITPYDANVLASKYTRSAVTTADNLISQLDGPNSAATNQSKNNWVEGDVFRSANATRDSVRSDGLQTLVAGTHSSKPISEKVVEGVYAGREFIFSEENDVVKLRSSLNNTKDGSNYNYTTNFDFAGGNDVLIVNRDAATLNGNQDGRVVTTVKMGEGNDIFAVGTSNTWYKTIRHKQTGQFDIVHYDTNVNSDWAVFGDYDFTPNPDGSALGGQMRHTNLEMGDGDDTVLLFGTKPLAPYVRAAYEVNIDLGEGNNRLVGAGEIHHTKAITKSKITAGDGIDVVKGAIFDEGTIVQLNGGDDEFIAGKLQDSTILLGDGDDWAEVTAYLNGGAKVLLGAGNDTFKQGAQGNDSQIIDGGSGSDLYWVATENGHAATSNVKGFEHILLSNNARFGIQADYIAELGSIMKITRQPNDKGEFTGQQVDFGMNGELAADKTNANNTYGDSEAHLREGKYWYRSGEINENGTHYVRYAFNKTDLEVWVENGIQVI